MNSSLLAKERETSRSLIFVRHAHRDNTKRELDNGLSDKGKKQVLSLTKLFTRRLSLKDGLKGPIIKSSPKVRCIETVEELAKTCQATIQIDSLLLEQQPEETESAFLRRVRRWIGQWKKSDDPFTLICSHGDWIPLAVLWLTGARIECKKASWIEVRIDEEEMGHKHPYIYTVIQNARRNY